MKVDVSWAGGAFSYGLCLEADDRREARRLFSVAENKIRLENSSYRVELPASFAGIHPDLHAAAVWTALRPFLGARLRLPFAVSESFARRMRELHGVAIVPARRAIAPRRPPRNSRPCLLLSGGMDSMAASRLMPPDTVHLFMDQIAHLESAPREGLTDLALPRAACRLVEAQGRELHMIREDHDPGLRRSSCIAGLSEAGTARVVHASPYRGKTSSCYYPSAGFACMRCDKCFRKVVLSTHIMEGTEVPEKTIDDFLSFPQVAAIFAKKYLDFHHEWYYVFQKIKCRHPFIRELQRQARRGPDMSLLERWYPPSAESIDPSYRGAVVAALGRHVASMSPRETARLKRLNLPALDPPKLSYSWSGYLGQSSAPPAPTSALPASCRPTCSGPLDHFAVNTTVRCQHRCVYCFEGERSGNKHLDSEEVRRLLRQAAEKAPAVIFMGAETTLRKDFVELVSFGRSLGLRMSLSTNALRFSDADFLRRALDAGLETIEMSFPYPDERTYQSITRAAPGGFGRLLKALENINLLAPRYGAFVEVITVVSQFNVARLGEVMRMLADRLRDQKFMVVLRRVGKPRLAAENPSAVRLDVLRSHLVRLLSGWEFRFPAAIRDFPLCAAPDFEHLDADLAYLRAGMRVGQNFFAQSDLSAMYPDENLYRRHRFSDVCARCPLDLLCLSRGLFVESEEAVAGRPLPGSRSPKEILIANGAAAEDVDSILAALQAQRGRSRAAHAEREGKAGGAPGGVSDAAPDERAKALERTLSRLLRPPRPPAPSFAGFAASSIRLEGGGGAVLIVLDRPALAGSGLAERLLLEARAARENERDCYRCVRGVAVCHRKDTPLDSPSRQEAVESFVRFLEDALRARPCRE